LSNNDQGRRGTIRGLQRSLKRLGGGSIDLYLIHRPLSARERYVEAWLAVIELKATGLARPIRSTEQRSYAFIGARTSSRTRSSSGQTNV